jgi:CIC family chloride channel protein
VRDVIDPNPEVIPASANFQTILDLVVQSDHSQFFVVDKDQKLLGAISLTEVRRLIYERETLQHLVVAGDLVDGNRPTVTEDEDLAVVMQLFSGSEVDEFAVVGADPLTLTGVVREKDVIDAQNRESMRRDLVGGLSSNLGAVEKGQTVDLGSGFATRAYATFHCASALEFRCCCCGEPESSPPAQKRFGFPAPTTSCARATRWSSRESFPR